MVYKKYKHSPVRKYREGLDDITDKLDSLTLNKKKMKINIGIICFISVFILIMVGLLYFKPKLVLKQKFLVKKVEGEGDEGNAEKKEAEKNEVCYLNLILWSLVFTSPMVFALL